MQHIFTVTVNTTHPYYCYLPIDLQYITVVTTLKINPLTLGLQSIRFLTIPVKNTPLYRPFLFPLGVVS